MNRAAESMTGANRDNAAGHKLGELFSLIDEADRRPLGDPVERCLSMRRRVNMGRRALLVSGDGEHQHSVEITASPVRGPGNSISGTVVVFHDVSEIRGLTRQMSYQATHDALTGLINRREFERRLQEALDSAHAEEGVHIIFRVYPLDAGGNNDGVGCSGLQRFSCMTGVATSNCSAVKL